MSDEDTLDGARTPEPDKPLPTQGQLSRAQRAREFLNTGIGTISAVAGLVGAVATAITVLSQTGLIGGGNRSSEGAVVQPSPPVASGTNGIAVTETNQRRLFALVPPDIRSSCFKTQAKVRQEGAIASWQCYPPVLDGSKDGVQYDMFPTRVQTDEVLRGDLVVNRRDRRTCPFAAANGAYRAVGEFTTRGHVACFRDTDFAWIVWTDDTTNVAGRAWRADLKLAPIEQWWGRHVLGDSTEGAPTDKLTPP